MNKTHLLSIVYLWSISYSWSCLTPTQKYCKGSCLTPTLRISHQELSNSRAQFFHGLSSSCAKFFFQRYLTQLFNWSCMTSNTDCSHAKYIKLWLVFISLHHQTLSLFIQTNHNGSQQKQHGHIGNHVIYPFMLEVHPP